MYHGLIIGDFALGAIMSEALRCMLLFEVLEPRLEIINCLVSGLEGAYEIGLIYAVRITGGVDGFGCPFVNVLILPSAPWFVGAASWKTLGSLS